MNEDINDFIRISFELGKEIALKSNLTEKEENFLQMLAIIAEKYSNK